MRKLSLSIRFSAAIFIIAMVCAIQTPAQAFTNVQVSAGSPLGLESAFLQATTSQFTATVVTNPFFPGTYQILLQDFNPRYAKPLSVQDLLQAVVQVSSTSYPYGFGAGQEYERHVDLGTLGNLAVNCANPSSFSLLQSSTSTWDQSTCLDVLGTLQDAIYQQNFSSPTVISGF